MIGRNIKLKKLSHLKNNKRYECSLDSNMTKLWSDDKKDLEIKAKIISEWRALQDSNLRPSA